MSEVSETKKLVWGRALASTGKYRLEQAVYDILCALDGEWSPATLSEINFALSRAGLDRGVMENQAAEWDKLLAERQEES